VVDRSEADRTAVIPSVADLSVADRSEATRSVVIPNAAIQVATAVDAATRDVPNGVALSAVPVGIPVVRIVVRIVVLNEVVPNAVLVAIRVVRISVPNVAVPSAVPVGIRVVRISVLNVVRILVLNAAVPSAVQVATLEAIPVCLPECHDHDLVRVARSVASREEPHAAIRKPAQVVRCAVRVRGPEHSRSYIGVALVFPIHLDSPIRGHVLDEAQAGIRPRSVAFPWLPELSSPYRVQSPLVELCPSVLALARERLSTV